MPPPKPGSSADSPDEAAPGRPLEIELASNRWLIHPLSARLADGLARTPVTPNQVSVAGVVAAAGAAACVAAAAWPWRALGALAFLLLWHVLDGADGALARRTGRASPIGELVDGVCDHAAQGLIYVALAFVLSRRIGTAAWPLAALSAACHFVQANAYESWRKSYRRFGHGAPWMSQSFRGGERPGAGWIGRAAAAVYLALSRLFLPDERAIEQAIAGGGPQAPERYRARYAPVTRRAGWLSSNTRTLALIVAMLAGGPAWYFAFEIVVLDIALAALTFERRRLDVRFLAAEAARAGSGA